MSALHIRTRFLDSEVVTRKVLRLTSFDRVQFLPPGLEKESLDLRQYLISMFTLVSNLFS